MLQSAWFADVRATLEICYYLAGIVIAGAAIYGLEQVRTAVNQLEFTKKLTETNNKREAVKFAADQCRYFAEQIVPQSQKFVSEYSEKHFTYLPAPTKEQPPPFTIKDGKISEHKFDMKLVAAEMPKMIMTAVTFLNAFESFAIPFVAGVADDQIGFQETAPVFCTYARWCAPALLYMFQIEGAKYASVLTLFSVWNARLVAAEAMPVLEQLQQLVAAGQKQIKLI